MKKQVWFVHGGESFASYSQYLKFLQDLKIDSPLKKKKKKWRLDMAEKLGQNYDVIFLDMPCAMNAKYKEWKIWFEKYIPFMKSPLILIGHSQGGIFLAKYLSENKLPKRIKSTFFVAAPFDDKDSDYSLADFKLKKDLSLISKQGGQVYFYQSQDDPVVPFSNLEKYQHQLPEATFRVFKKRHHFIGPSFPEIVRDIKSLK